jgi:hypothetical protein
MSPLWTCFGAAGRRRKVIRFFSRCFLRGEDEGEDKDEISTPMLNFLERRFGDMVGWSDNFGERKADEPYW